MHRTARSAAVIIVWALLLGACSGGDTAPLPAETAEAPVAATPAPAAAPDISKLPAGDYRVDPSHASLTFKVNHLGFSTYTAQFRTFTVDLKIDLAKPEAATVRAEVDVASLSLPTPPAGFEEEVKGEQWLNAAVTPKLIFESTSVTKTGPATADVVGNLTLRGVSKPITLHVTFNGGWEGHAQDPFARIGFSANGVLKRSDFGITHGIPAPGSSMGVSDNVDFQIETELLGPPWPQTP
jgi:polyisoprenoid-binding protein YceI